MNEIITERPNLFEPNVYIAMCVEIAGSICPHKLAAAVREAYKANEATMSKIVLAQGAAYYERLSVSGCQTVVTDKSWPDLIKINEKVPFALDKGELVRTFILPNETDTRVLIMAHHLAGDGKSLLYFIQDMMNALAGVPLVYKPLTLLTPDSLPKTFPKTALSVSARLYARHCRRKWKNHFFTWQDYYTLHHKYWENASSDIQYTTLSAAETAGIIEQAKQIGCSVNSCLVTMLLQRYQKSCEVGIPVSIREKGNKSMSNLTSGISIRYRYNNQKSFAENARCIHRKIKKTLQKNKFFVLQFLAELPMTLIDAVLLYTHGCCLDPLAAQTAKIMEYKGGKTRDAGITNLAIPDIPVLYGSYKIKNIIFVPPAVSYSQNVTGILTVNGKMTVARHHMIISD